MKGATENGDQPIEIMPEGARQLERAESRAAQGCSGCGKTGASKIIRGATGLAKAALGIDRAPPEAKKDRWAACLGCSELNWKMRLCRACGCFVLAKLRIMAERCPRGRWRE